MEMTYAEAIRDAQDICLASDPNVFIMGLGVPDDKGVFGTTLGLAEKYPGRVFDMPLSENAMTGVCIGAALRGMKPILVHQRMDFALLSMDQIVNQAAKWKAMFGDDVPLVIRMIIGRGWGQGPQHSQSLQAMYAHVPGLKVVMPSRPHDAHALLLDAVEDPDPVVFIEHRWLHGVRGEVGRAQVWDKIGFPSIPRSGGDVVIVATSYMVLEALRAADDLAASGIEATVVDIRTICPVRFHGVISLASKIGRLVVCDTGHIGFGVGAEIVARVAEEGVKLLHPPVRIGLPDYPAPTAHKLAATYYPRAADIVNAVLKMMGKREEIAPYAPPPNGHFDQPDPTFQGPF